MFAAMNNTSEVITTLLKAGADAKTKESRGYTAFFWANLNAKLEGTNAMKQLFEASK